MCFRSLGLVSLNRKFYEKHMNELVLLLVRFSFASTDDIVMTSRTSSEVIDYVPRPTLLHAIFEEIDYVVPSFPVIHVGLHRCRGRR